LRRVGTAVATEFAVIFYKCHKAPGRFTARAFTLVETVVAVAVIGVGVASTLGALTKFNQMAATSRNATGASAVLINQTDLFQSMSPFNPQRTPAQIPGDTDKTYDMSLGTHTLNYKDPTTNLVSAQADPWPVYREPASWTYANAAARTSATGFVAADVGQLAYESDTQTYWRLIATTPSWTADTTGGIIVKGTMTVTVTDISPTPGSAPYIYQAVFTIGYQYLGRGPTWNVSRNRWEYQLSMVAVRTSDI
jgi:prepilin-type N-terminal cleavage/methylation domain-containing protein